VQEQSNPFVPVISGTCWNPIVLRLLARYRRRIYLDCKEPAKRPELGTSPSATGSLSRSPRAERRQPPQMESLGLQGQCRIALISGQAWPSVCFGNGMFVADSGNNGGGNVAATSVDGVN
jgi:hypothetical protein